MKLREMSSLRRLDKVFVEESSPLRMFPLRSKMVRTGALMDGTPPENEQLARYNSDKLTNEPSVTKVGIEPVRPWLPAKLSFHNEAKAIHDELEGREVNWLSLKSICMREDEKFENVVKLLPSTMILVADVKPMEAGKGPDKLDPEI
jgi:hypothetical protein